MKLIYRLILILVVTFFINSTIYAYTIYSVGDEVTYNNINYYVIKDSSSDDDSVTMLKSEPLTVDEVNQYGVGHINRYTYDTVGIVYDNNGYGGMAYYSSETCGYVNGRYVNSGCTIDYAQSEVKYVVDAWKAVQASAASEARLFTIEEVTSLGYEWFVNGSTEFWKKTENVPSWLYNENYWYWLDSQYNDSSSGVWGVIYNGGLYYNEVGSDGVVRPVITLKKTTLGDEDESIKEDVEVLPDSKNNVDKKETTTKVKVENTYMSQTLIVMIIGFISICSGVVIYYLIKNKKTNN